MVDKIKNRVLKIKNKSINSSPNIENISKLDNEIYKSEKEKTRLLLELGILTYEKIRENNIEDSDYRSITSRILELDRAIYSKKKELESTQNNEVDVICECGNKIDLEDKFCSECGNKVVLEENTNDLIICNYCSNEIDSDSNYCPCCGNKKM